MKFISYSHNDEHKFGILDNDLITDVTGKISGATSLKELIFKDQIFIDYAFKTLFLNSRNNNYIWKCLSNSKNYF